MAPEDLTLAEMGRKHELAIAEHKHSMNETQIIMADATTFACTGIGKLETKIDEIPPQLATVVRMQLEENGTPEGLQIPVPWSKRPITITGTDTKRVIGLAIILGCMWWFTHDAKEHRDPVDPKIITETVAQVGP